MYVKVDLDHRMVKQSGDMVIDGVTKEVVATKPDIGFVIVAKEEQRKGLLGSTWFRKIGFLVYDPELLDPMDSIMCSNTIFRPGSTTTIQGYEMLAGKTQPCAEFLSEWRKWVFNPIVQDSAKSYIIRHHPKITLPENKLLTEERKGLRLWLSIADTIFPTKVAENFRGKFPIDPLWRPSNIQVQYLPMQIAQKNWGLEASDSKALLRATAKTLPVAI